MIKLVRIEDVPDELLYAGMKLGIIIGYASGILLHFIHAEHDTYRTIQVHWKTYGNFQYNSCQEGYHNIGVEVGKCKKLNELWEKDKIRIEARQ